MSAIASTVSVTRQSRAAKGLRDAWARVQRAESASAKYRHVATNGDELAKAREAFCDLAAAALGLGDNERPACRHNYTGDAFCGLCATGPRTTISDEDSQ